MFKMRWKNTAEILRDNQPRKKYSLAYETWLQIREDFANLFEEESEKFDREKFITACNPL